jgi:hypothetical protein
VLRKICGLKREEVMGDRRKLRNDVLHDSHSPPISIWAKADRVGSWVGHMALNRREGRGAYRVLVRKPEGKRPL